MADSHNNLNLDLYDARFSWFAACSGFAQRTCGKKKKTIVRVADATRAKRHGSTFRTRRQPWSGDGPQMLVFFAKILMCYALDQMTVKKARRRSTNCPPKGETRKSSKSPTNWKGKRPQQDSVKTETISEQKAHSDRVPRQRTHSHHVQTWPRIVHSVKRYERSFRCFDVDVPIFAHS